MWSLSYFPSIYKKIENQKQWIYISSQIIYLKDKAKREDYYLLSKEERINDRKLFIEYSRIQKDITSK